MPTACQTFVTELMAKLHGNRETFQMPRETVCLVFIVIWTDFLVAYIINLGVDV